VKYVSWIQKKESLSSPQGRGEDSTSRFQIYTTLGFEESFLKRKDEMARTIFVDEG
jgi:hypothetical protein